MGSQSSFSLEEAVQFALENNYNMKNARTDVEIAKRKINETTAIGLPQIAGTISNTNYMSLPTTLFPDFITGAIYQVNEEKFGLVPVVPQAEQGFFSGFLWNKI